MQEKRGKTETTDNYSFFKCIIYIYALVAILGATMDLGVIWEVAETFNGLMAIPNLIGVFMLSGTVVKLVKNYFSDEEYIPYHEQAKMLKGNK